MLKVATMLVVVSFHWSPQAASVLHDSLALKYPDVRCVLWSPREIDCIWMKIGLRWSAQVKLLTRTKAHIGVYANEKLVNQQVMYIGKSMVSP